MLLPSPAPLALLLLVVIAPEVAPSELGFVAHFSALDEHGFGSSQSTVVNVPSGGVAGVGESGSTFFLSNQGFNPPADHWQRYSVSFENPSAWTRIKGNGTFAEALATADRLLFRHDVPPLTSMPNDTIGDFGLDRISVLPCAYEVYGTDAGGSNVTVLDTAEASTLDTTHTWVTRGAVPSTTGFLRLSPVSADLADPGQPKGWSFGNGLSAVLCE
jgi:hypothetical protein